MTRDERTYCDVCARPEHEHVEGSFTAELHRKRERRQREKAMVNPLVIECRAPVKVTISIEGSDG